MKKLFFAKILLYLLSFFFSQIIKQYIKENGNFIISTVPSSKVNKVNGTDLIAHLLKSNNKEKVIDAGAITSIQKKENGNWGFYMDVNKTLLKRVKDLQKKSHGGPRTFQIERDSLVINEVWRNKIQGKIILLLDDVITTGISMQTCQKILYDAGAARVICLALGRTK